MSRARASAAIVGGFFNAMAGMLALIAVLPVAAIDRTAYGALLFVPLWVGMIITACLAPGGWAAWRRQLGVFVVLTLVAVTGFFLRS
ncbi:MAG: hypothetical protein AAF799_09145 [Myxococcota bacterium]